MKIGSLCAGCLFLAAAIDAFSTPLTDARQILGTTSARVLSSSVIDARSAAPDVPLAAFDAQLIASCALDGVDAQVRASQVSTISSYSFTGEGAVSALASVNVPNASASADVQSIFNTSFCLTEPLEFLFGGALYQSLALSYPWATVQLLNADGPLFTFDRPGAFLQTGILQPGVYSLAAQAGAVAAADNGDRDQRESSYSFNLSLLQQQSVPDSGATLLLLFASVSSLFFWQWSVTLRRTATIRNRPQGTR
jgi:hypothetical protein